MAQIESIYAPEVEAQLKRISSEISNQTKQVLELSKLSVNFNGGKTSRTPKDLDKVVDDMAKIEKQAERTRISEIKLQKARERAFDVYEKNYQKEQARLAASQNLYNKTQQQLNKIQQAYNDLATKKERYNNLTANEEARLKTLQSVTEKYNNTLKAVDATVGKHTRNVGNYKSAFDPLSNSINQLTREAPAFAVSMNTGFLAISNNLPIFFDAMQQAIAQQKELQAQGQPSKNALQLLASSLSSFQTLLSVGVTLLTLYGGKIIESITNSKKKKEALEEEKKALEEKTRAEKEDREITARYQGDEIARSKILFERAKNVTVSYKDRLKAIKELKERYPDYLSKLSDEEILAGKTADAENELNLALMKRGLALAIQDKIQENIKKELELNLESAETSKKAIDYMNEAVTASNKIVIATDAEAKAKKFKEEEERAQILKTNKENLNKLTLLRSQRKSLIDLYYEYAKYLSAVNEDTGSNSKRNKSIENLIASEFELRKAILERKKAELTQISTNSDLFLNDRIEALRNLSLIEQDLIMLNLEYSLTVEKQKKEAKIKEYKEALKENLISQEQFNENIKQIELQSSYDIEQINIELGQKLQENALKTANSIKALEKEKSDFIIKNNEQINKKQQDENKRIANDETKRLKERQLAYIEFIYLAKKELDIAKIREIANAKSAEEIDYIREKYAQLNAELDRMLEKESPFAKNEEWLKEFKKGFQDDFISNSGFDNIFFLIENFDKLKESGIGTALAISEAFQQAFNTIATASQSNYDAEYSRLEAQKEISLKFAGESASAKEEVEKQYQDRKKVIQRREAEAQKRLAIFNIITNTAQAVLATYAKVGFPTGVPLAVAMGAIGLFQAGLVASQEIPQFWKGTDNAPEGWALVDEKRPEVHTDRYGKVKSLGEKGANLRYLEKGDKIYKSHEDYINKELKHLGINSLGSWSKNFQPKVELNNSVDLSGVQKEISNLASNLKKQKPVNVTVYKDKTFLREGTMEISNARHIIKGRTYTR